MAKILVQGGMHSTPEERKCSKYRTIRRIVHASKVLPKIIKCRIKLHYAREMAEEQAGFVEGKGTREQIANITRQKYAIVYVFH